MQTKGRSKGWCKGMGVGGGGSGNLLPSQGSRQAVAMLDMPRKEHCQLTAAHAAHPALAQMCSEKHHIRQAKKGTSMPHHEPWAGGMQCWGMSNLPLRQRDK
jgi:hypothetical protein